MVNNYLFVLIFVIILIAVIGIMQYQLKKERIPPQFIQLLNEVERFQDPVLKSLQVNKLPDPVQRYIHLSHANLMNRPSFVQIHYSGFSRIDPDSNLLPITGKTYYCISKPGFFSQRRINQHNFIWTDIDQRYAIHSGYVTGKLFSVYPVFSFHGLSVDRLSQARYFCGAVWFPWILEPAANIEWEPVNDYTARLKITYHTIPVHLEINFDNKGLIHTISTPGEYRNRAGNMISFDLIVSFGRYLLKQGITVPQAIDIMWKLPEGDRIQEHLEITNIEYHSVL